MKNLIFIYGYNNYYNRKVKYSNNLSDYITDYTSVIKENINFNLNDGVNAKLTANLDIDLTDAAPDYTLVVNEYGEIISRWFIMEMRRNLNGQYYIHLRRDVVADYFDRIQNVPIFVQKGLLNPSNKLIYNNEGMAFNQIKTSEIILKDETDTNWIVGYVNSDKFEEKDVTVSFDRTVPVLETFHLNLTDPTDPAKGGDFRWCEKMSIFTTADGGTFNHTRQFVDLNAANFRVEGRHYTYQNPEDSRSYTFRRISGDLAFDNEALNRSWYGTMNSYSAALASNVYDFFDGQGIEFADAEERDAILALNGKMVYSNLTQKYYILSIATVDAGRTVNTKIQNETYGVALYNTCRAAADRVYIENGVKVGDHYWVSNTSTIYTLVFAETAGPGQYKVTIKPGFNELVDAPYSMFALKFNLINMEIASRLWTVLGSFGYDIQILPYFPCRDRLLADGTIDIGVENIDYTPIKKDDTVVDYMYWATSSSYQFTINKSIPSSLTSALDIKLANECDMYRLCSPNYNGVYEFNVAKNGGVDYFNVSFTYKPFSPYIRVAPNFKNLYGQNFEDSRGLICLGDYSMSTLSDAWVQYEINNKNYMNIFNNQIHTQDANRQIQRIGEGVGAVAGAVSTGATLGAIAGPAAGVAGGMASMAGGVVDMAISESLYQNNRQASINQFNYQLQNVMARPNSLTKVSAYNIDNKYFPFVEYYTCTEEEKNALKQKIKYEGMTVMTIGTISDYRQVETIEGYNYFKGQLIQAGDISEDYHIVDTLAAELERGVYL